MMGLSDKQTSVVLDAKARIVILEGSVRSGKSFASLLLFMRDLKEGPEGRYVVCGKSETTIIRNVVEPLNDLCGGIIRYNRGMREFTLFGRKVYVVGANDERAEGKIRGNTFAGALVDEVTILPQTFFRMLLSRLSIPNARLIGTTNPDSPYHWLKADFIDRQDELDIQIYRFTLTDNPVLTQKFIDDLKKEYRGLWYKRFIEGAWVMAEGAIYDFFDKSVHVVERPPTYAKYYILGVDYGTTNPFAAVLIGFNDEHHPTIWAEKEYYFDSKQVGYQKTDSEYAQDLRNQFSDYPIRATYLDPSAASFEVELKRQRWPVKQAKNDVTPGIRYMASVLADGDFVICKGCNNLMKEIEGYVWDEAKSRRGIEEPLKQRDHAVDACRYALFTHFGHLKSLRDPPQTSGSRRPVANPMDEVGWGPGWQRQ